MMEIEAVEEPFTCEVCGKSFPKNANLGYHKWREHDIRAGNKCFTCPVCAKVIRGRSKQSLTSHMKSHQAVTPFKCDKCGRGFKTSDHLNRHQKVHQENRQMAKCELCSRVFVSLLAVERHVIAVHVDDKEFQCEICDSAFLEEAELESHKRVNHERNWKCDACPKCFSSSKHLRRHLSRVHCGREFCILCLKSFSNQETYQEHIQERTDSGFVVCPAPDCKSAFGTPCLADQHWSEVHKPKMEISTVADDRREDEKRINCELCEESFTSYQDLSSHHRRVHPKKEWECKICQKTFKLKANCTMHMRSSHGVEPEYKCEICFKLYQTPRSLQKHIKSHDANSPYKCSKCPKSYTQQAHLQYHLASSHGEGEKPHKCPHCPKRFFYKSDLENSHIPSHFDVRPFSCDNCQRRYKTKATMLKHKRLWCLKDNSNETWKFTGSTVVPARSLLKAEVAGCSM